MKTTSTLWYSVKGCMDISGLSMSTIRRAIWNNELKSVKQKQKIFVKAEWLEDYLTWRFYPMKAKLTDSLNIINNKTERRLMRHTLTTKDLNRAKKREYRKKHGCSPADGSSVSREMAQASRLSYYRKLREEKGDPYTSHPLSFEEFDSIPDIGDLTEKPIKQKGEYMLQNGEYILQKGDK